MSQRKTEVVDGLRGPGVREPRQVDQQEELARQAREVRGADADEFVFQAKAVAYRFQVTAPSDLFDPTTGKKSAAKPVFAQFKDGVYRTKDVDSATSLLASRHCGVGRDFWLVEDMKAHRLEQEEQQFAERLAADPQLRERVLSRLGASVTSFAPPAKSGAPEGDGAQ